MFTSALEAAKFEGATLKTVSGVRGTIKKAVKEDVSDARAARAGAFRATFEDKVLKSDIVVCRLWVPVSPPDVCVPIRNLCAPADDEVGGLMRTVAQLRRDLQVPLPVDVDSMYKPVERAPRKFSKQILPAKLVAALPFASQPKAQVAKKSEKNPGYLARRRDPASGLAPKRDAADRAADKLVHKLNAVRNAKKRTRDATKAEKKKVRARVVAKVDASRAAASKAKNKAEYRRQGKDAAKKRAKFEG